MIRATSVRAKDTWTEGTGTVVADTVVLDFDERHRRRIAMTGVRGLAFLLDLPEALALRGGDALALEDGRLVEVVAAPEPLCEVRGADAASLVRLAWHIGNRHLPAQLTGRAIRIRRDPVIADMLRGLGAKIVDIEAPFDPEGGAYATPTRESRDAGRGHGAGHAHDHGHDHGDGHKHDHGHDGHHGHHGHHGHDH